MDYYTVERDKVMRDYLVCCSTLKQTFSCTVFFLKILFQSCDEQLKAFRPRNQWSSRHKHPKRTWAWSAWIQHLQESLRSDTSEIPERPGTCYAPTQSCQTGPPLQASWWHRSLCRRHLGEAPSRRIFRTHLCLYSWRAVQKPSLWGPLLVRETRSYHRLQWAPADWTEEGIAGAHFLRQQWRYLHNTQVGPIDTDRSRAMPISAKYRPRVLEGECISLRVCAQ